MNSTLTQENILRRIIKLIISILSDSLFMFSQTSLLLRIAKEGYLTRSELDKRCSRNLFPCDNWYYRTFQEILVRVSELENDLLCKTILPWGSESGIHHVRILQVGGAPQGNFWGFYDGNYVFTLLFLKFFVLCTNKILPNTRKNWYFRNTSKYHRFPQILQNLRIGLGQGGGGCARIKNLKNFRRLRRQWRSVTFITYPVLI